MDNKSELNKSSSIKNSNQINSIKNKNSSLSMKMNLTKHLSNNEIKHRLMAMGDLFNQISLSNRSKLVNMYFKSLINGNKLAFIRNKLEREVKSGLISKSVYESIFKIKEGKNKLEKGLFLSGTKNDNKNEITKRKRAKNTKNRIKKLNFVKTRMERSEKIKDSASNLDKKKNNINEVKEKENLLINTDYKNLNSNSKEIIENKKNNNRKYSIISKNSKIEMKSKLNDNTKMEKINDKTIKNNLHYSSFSLYPKEMKKIIKYLTMKTKI